MDKTAVLASLDKLPKPTVKDFTKTKPDGPLDMYRVVADKGMRLQVEEARAGVQVQGPRGRDKETKFIFRIHPSFDAPERVRVSRPRRAGTSRRTTAAPRLRDEDLDRLPDFFDYIRSNHEAWVAENQQGLNANPLVNEIRRMGVDKVREALREFDAANSDMAWRKHLEDTFGPAIVRRFESRIAAAE